MSHSHFYLIFLVFYFADLPRLALGFGGNIEERDLECNKPKRCKRHGEPAVRFPFRLRDHHPPHCGYPDPEFELSCNENKNTVLNPTQSTKLFVKNIDYNLQEIEFYDPNRCLPRLLLDINPDLNLSSSPFRYIEKYSFLSSLVLFNCSLTSGDENDGLGSFDSYVPCLSTARGYGVRAVDELSSVLSLTGCRRIYFPLPAYVRYSLFEDNKLFLNWSRPNCMKCEGEGRGCRLMEGDFTRTECFDLPKKAKGEKRKILIMTGAILGSFLLIVATIGIYYIHHSCKVKRNYEIKIKQFLEDYKALKSTRYTYADIWKITHQFKQKLGQGGFGTVYKGKLTNNILVAVKMLNHNSTGNGDEFINEVASMGMIHHVNVARLVGFCADGAYRALVYEFLPNESLEKFIFSEKDKKVVLGWERLQDIALGIAKGMEYLHHGCEQQILHFDIKPHNILLDRDFVPKISDFGLAKLCSKEKSVVTMTAARGTMGYIAPEVASRNFGKPSYKSDVYSFGMLLLEMVGGRRNIDVNVENASRVYFPEWVYTHLDQLGGELGIEIEEEGHAKIAKKLTIVALWCVQWNPMDRPSMKVVVQMLEGDGDNLTVPPNPFASGDSTDKKNATKPSRSNPQHVELEIISELE